MSSNASFGVNSFDFYPFSYVSRLLYYVILSSYLSSCGLVHLLFLEFASLNRVYLYIVAHTTQLNFTPLLKPRLGISRVEWNATFLFFCMDLIIPPCSFI